jgi:hypothetical protein
VDDTTTGPCGIESADIHTPTLVWLRVGTPPTRTRTSGTTHWTRTHGLGFGPGRVNAHPEMVKVSEIVTIFEPAASVVAFDDEIDTVPPCGHDRLDAVVSVAVITTPPTQFR